MAIPGLSLPDPTTIEPSAPVIDRIQRYQLAAETEYRFESSFLSPLTIRLLSGTAELFGTELAPGVTYTFRGQKAAVYTWYGCELEVVGNPEADYVAEETPMMQVANVHFALEDLRSDASDAGGQGPRIMVVGPENAGKTSLVKTMTAYALKAGRQPVVVNLDPRQGLLSMPGSLSATTMTTLLDIEEGWGSSPISGPSALPVKMPLCYHYGCQNPEDNEKLFKPLVSRLALAIKGRIGNDPDPKRSGCLIDTPGSLSSGRPGGYDLIEHIALELAGTVP
jgi:polyribonucleotide 5'-hydroxyl-kinase